VQKSHERRQVAVVEEEKRQIEEDEEEEEEEEEQRGTTNSRKAVLASVDLDGASQHDELLLRAWRRAKRSNSFSVLQLASSAAPLLFSIHV
jgi:hypothetical protein